MGASFVRPAAVSSLAGTLLRQAGNPRLSSPAWACAKCRRGQWSGQRSKGLRFSSTTANPGRTGAPPPPRSSRGRRVMLLAASGGAAMATILAFTDDIKQSYEAVERAGRVGGALVLCINE